MSRLGASPLQVAVGHVIPLRPRPETALEVSDLVARLRVRDPVALGSFFDQYSPLVTGLLRRCLAGHEVADLRQETFLQLLASLDRIRNPHRLEAWVRSVTLNTLRTEMRRRQWRRFLPFGAPSGEDDEFEIGGTDEASHETRAALRAARRLLSRLPTDERLAFCLRHFEQLELTECAEALGCSLATVKRRLVRAEATLRSHAGEEPALAPWLPREESS